MTGHQCFIDSNIFIYAHDVEDRHKHKTANDLFLSFWEQSRMPSLSIQVLQETYANFIRKNMSPAQARSFIEPYFKWHLIENSLAVFQEGMRLKEKLKLSVWDSFIIAAAKEAGSEYILSEDLTHNHNYDGIKVINPFIQN